VYWRGPELLFFGSPDRGKGFFTLLKALRILRDEGIKINLEVYGIYGKDAEQTAKREVRRNHVTDQIQWCSSLSELEFDEKMQESSFTFAVYTERVWGSSIITRAMVNGTPAIATYTGGNSEHLGDTGTYAPPSDPSALAFVKSHSSRFLRSSCTCANNS
jgi:glycosyltransferase involved in cell wall biosynthesis